VIPEDSRFMVRGQQVAGWLAVPAWSPDGELRTLQLIPPEEGRAKLNLPGHAFADGSLCLGDPADSPRIHIVEGIGQAWACRTAHSDSAVVVAFGAARIAAITAQFRGRFPKMRLVIVSDRGKETESASIALKHGALWVAMPEDKPQNFDANDL